MLRFVLNAWKAAHSLTFTMRSIAKRFALCLFFFKANLYHQNTVTIVFFFPEWVPWILVRIKQQNSQYFLHVKSLLAGSFVNWKRLRRRRTQQRSPTKVSVWSVSCVALGFWNMKYAANSSRYWNAVMHVCVFVAGGSLDSSIGYVVKFVLSKTRSLNWRKIWKLAHSVYVYPNTCRLHASSCFTQHVIPKFRQNLFVPRCFYCRPNVSY